MLPDLTIIFLLVLGFFGLAAFLLSETLIACIHN
jgi:hypothetical protein